MGSLAIMLLTRQEQFLHDTCLGTEGGGVMHVAIFSDMPNKKPVSGTGHASVLR
jgi:hypothetical protein